MQSPERKTPTDDDYMAVDPFEGDRDANIKLRKVEIRKARKEYTCFTLTGKQDHTIKPGDRYRYEQALVDGDYWGKYRICLPCLDKFFADIHGEDDE